MKSHRGTSLASLFLFIGATALLATLGRAVLMGFKVPPPPKPSYFPWGPPPFPYDRVAFFLVLVVSAALGLACGIFLAFRRPIGLGKILLLVPGGLLLGCLTGAQLVSPGDVRVVLMGGAVLIAYSLLNRTKGSAIRAPDEIEWFTRLVESESKSFPNSLPPSEHAAGR